MSGRVRWLSSARYDLIRLFNWIADEADVDTAEAYTTQIEAHTNKLSSAPRRGSPRDELVRELRSTVYRRRTIIFYRVAEDDSIEVVNLVHGGRNLKNVFPSRD